MRGNVTNTRIWCKSKAPRKNTWKALSSRAPAVYTTYAHVYTISNYNSLELQPLGDRAAECTTIKIQRGPFYHSPHLGFSTIKLGLRLKLIPGRKNTGVLKPLIWISQKQNSQIFLQHNSLSISYPTFFRSPSGYLNLNLPLDKPTLFQEVNHQLAWPKARAYLYIVVLKPWCTHVGEFPVFKCVFQCSKGNNGQSFFRNLHSQSVGKCQVLKGTRSSIEAGYHSRTKQFQRRLRQLCEESDVGSFCVFYNLKRNSSRGSHHWA